MEQKREITQPRAPKKAWKKPEIKSTLDIKDTLSDIPGGVDMGTLMSGMSDMGS